MVKLDDLYKLEEEIKEKISFWQMQLEILQAYKLNKANKEIVVPKYEYINNEAKESWYKVEE